MSYSIRVTEPDLSNPYYIHTSYGGLNECIIRDSATGSVLPNCVGYAWGRAYEIMGTRPTLSKNNAERWFGEGAEGYTRSQTPRVASIMCWQKGEVGVGEDGAGHVAVLESIGEDGSLFTTNSDYSGRNFYIREFNGEPTLSGYKFQGYIYLPIDDLPDTPIGPDSPEGTTNIKKKKFNFVLFNNRRRRIW